MAQALKPAPASTGATATAPEAVANIGADEDYEAQIAAIQKRRRDNALAQIGADPEAVKAEIADVFATIEKKANALKTAYKGGGKPYYAPWDIQSKRDDWRIRDFILEQAAPQTVEEIVEGLDNTDADAVQAVLDKDARNTRHLFAFVGNKVWIDGKPVPKK